MHQISCSFISGYNNIKNLNMIENQKFIQTTEMYSSAELKTSQRHDQVRNEYIQ